MFDRRGFLAAGLGGTAAFALLGWGKAKADDVKVLNLGFQKTGIPLVARQLKVFEKRFEPKGIAVNWVEFPSGLTLLQALDLGNLNFGNAGNVGCIFVQAAGGRIVYVAAQPTAPKSEGILVREASPISRIADLKGRKVGYAKGSSSHNLIAAALEAEGLTIADVETVGLSAADGAFAYDNGSIDAWVIWDPYFSIAQARSPSRVLAFVGDVLKDNAGFLLANADFAAAHPEHVVDLIEGSREAGAWAKAHLDEVTAALAAATGIEASVLTTVNANASFDVTPLSEPLLAAQQATADRLFKLGVVPKEVAIRDIVWKAPA